MIQQIYLFNDYGFEQFVRRVEIEELYHSMAARGEAPLIVDCGANIGLASKYFAQTFPSANIVAIEPDKSNAQQARINCQSHDITLFEAAVASAEGRGSLIDPGLGSNAYRVARSPGGELSMLSINTITKEAIEKRQRPFIIKIDVEGFEGELFSQNTEWIEQFPVMIIELHDWMLPKAKTSESFLKAISKLDRDFIYRGENVFSISNAAFPRAGDREARAVA